MYKRSNPDTEPNDADLTPENDEAWLEAAELQAEIHADWEREDR
jgi:hypothetical protein